MFASQAAMVIANARRYRDERRARNDLETLINTSPVGVAVFDVRTGAPLSFNREAMRMMDTLRNPDQPPEHLLEVMTVRRADGREISLEELPMSQALSAGETVRAEEVALQVPDGRSVTVLINATPNSSEDGEIETLVVTMQDMTPLEEIERLRAEFLAMVSHELRTPLATVRGSVSALLDEFSEMHPAEVRQFHRIIFEQTDRMRALIADLLDVARIATGALSINPGPTDVAVLTAEAGNAFRIGGHGHNLHIDIPPDLPWVMADRSRIVQVLGNLLTNAAKNSPETSTIRVSAAPGDLQVSVSVSDDGRGIAAESLPHLFRKFSRLESEEQGRRHRVGPRGLQGDNRGARGTYMGRERRARPGRHLYLHPSDGGRGGVRLPGGAPSALHQTLAQVGAGTGAHPGGGRRPPGAQGTSANALIKSGYAVVATSDPEDVLHLVEEEKPHLVLLDLMLPGVDGIDLMKDIVAARDVPVIFVSAYGQDRLVARAFEMGADDYVVKPFSPTELVARIKAALRRRTLSEPAVPYVVGDLIINYAERLVTLAGKPIDLTAIQYRLLVELSVNAGRVLTYEHLLRRVWGTDGDADVRPMRTSISAIRRKLGDDADNPTYICHRASCGLPDAHGRGADHREGDLRKRRSRCIVPTRRRPRAIQDFGVALRDCWRRQPALFQEGSWDVKAADADALRYPATLVVWVRWFIFVTLLILLVYRPDYSPFTYAAYGFFLTLMVALNGYIHHQVRSGRTVMFHWALALSALDLVLITGAMVVTGGFSQNLFYLLQYPALAWFAVFFSSFRLTFAWVTMVAVIYAVVSLTVGEGLNFEAKDDKALIARIASMYAVVTAVNLVSSSERMKRREAVERERALQRERVELSQHHPRHCGAVRVRRGPGHRDGQRPGQED